MGFNQWSPPNLGKPRALETLHNKAEADAQQVAVEDILWGLRGDWTLQLSLNMPSTLTPEGSLNEHWPPPHLGSWDSVHPLRSAALSWGEALPFCTPLETKPSLEY